jgi:NAD(P)H dehydrogenase (quinone)
MSRSRFLITGATGATGGNAAELLISQGFPVRALVHREDERSARLRAKGAEIVVGDLLNLDDVSNALKGVEAAYFVYPILPGLIEATAYFAQAAKEAGVSAIVNMSQISARREAKSHGARNHWIAERVLDWSGVPVTHLRPTFFAQWLLYPANRATIVERGTINLAFGEGRHAPIAAEDQARLIAAILAKPAAHGGKVYPLCGPIEMGQADIAATLSDLLGRKITYQPITIPEFRERLEKAGRPEFLIQHLCAVAIDYQNGIFAGEDKIIAEVTGKPPMTVQEFVALHSDAFKSASSAVSARARM